MKGWGWVLVMVVSSLVSAEIPQMISYQGKVTDASGTPVADGNYPMRFRIYDAATGGTPLWDSGDRTVAVSGGVFSVLLGQSPQPAIGLAFDADYWLEVTFNGVVQSPRQRLASVGYAYMASGLVPGTEVSGSVTSSPYAAIKAANTATTGVTYGIWGESSSTSGRGVCGVASATTGTTYGVYGGSSSTSGRGVYGWASATTGTTYGVYGGSSSTSGRGVYGSASATSGVAVGVYGRTSSTTGFGVYYSGGLAGTGTKSCVVKTSKGPTLMYCQESPENWFEDFGEGTLVNGRAHIELDPLFLETVTIDEANPMKVFVTPGGRLGAWWVEKATTSFDLVAPEALDGTRFDYRVVAKRKGYETKRLDHCKAAETDSYLYPELREKELKELEEERARLEKERARMEEEHQRMERERLLRDEEHARHEAERARMDEERARLRAEAESPETFPAHPAAPEPRE